MKGLKSINHPSQAKKVNCLMDNTYSDGRLMHKQKVHGRNLLYFIFKIIFFQETVLPKENLFTTIFPGMIVLKI